MKALLEFLLAFHQHFLRLDHAFQFSIQQLVTFFCFLALGTCGGLSGAVLSQQRERQESGPNGQPQQNLSHVAENRNRTSPAQARRTLRAAWKKSKKTSKIGGPRPARLNFRLCRPNQLSYD